MKECVREPEIVEAVLSGRWVQACDPDLWVHGASCPICAEVVLAAGALRADRDVALQDVRVPSAGLVWWRAELRARQEAARKSERPMSLMQAFAAACSVGVAVALAGGVLPSVLALFSFATPAGSIHLVLAIALAAVLVAAPVALYFVFSDK